MWAIGLLEEADFVDFFAPNDRRVGLTIPYEYQDAPHQYVPDFLVRLRDGRRSCSRSRARRGSAGTRTRSRPRTPSPGSGWPRSTTTVRRVEPRPEDKYRTCVPLAGLRAAAGAGEADHRWLDRRGRRGLSEFRDEPPLIGRDVRGHGPGAHDGADDSRRLLLWCTRARKWSAKTGIPPHADHPQAGETRER